MSKAFKINKLIIEEGADKFQFGSNIAATIGNLPSQMGPDSNYGVQDMDIGSAR